MDRDHGRRDGASERAEDRRVGPGDLDRLRVRAWGRAGRDARARRPRHPLVLRERSTLPRGIPRLMRVPLSWLREFVPIDTDPDELATRLSLTGIKVEEVIQIGSGI